MVLRIISYKPVGKILQQNQVATGWAVAYIAPMETFNKTLQDVRRNRLLKQLTDELASDMNHYNSLQGWPGHSVTDQMNRRAVKEFLLHAMQARALRVYVIATEFFNNNQRGQQQ